MYPASSLCNNTLFAIAFYFLNTHFNRNFNRYSVNVELNVLATTDLAKQQTSMHFIDELTEKFGKESVKVAYKERSRRKTGI